MEEIVRINASNYSALVDKMHEICQTHSTGTIKSLYQNLNIGCKCQHRNKRLLFSSKIVAFFNNECDQTIKDTIKNNFNTKKMEIYCIDSNNLLITI